jgi:hypothetical protein
VRFALTENATSEFVRRPLMLVSERITSKAYLIHDNALMFNIDYLAYHLVSAKTGEEVPNIKGVVERCFGSLRREALDNFLLIGRSQIEAILEERLAFYKSQRPHQGIQQQIRRLGESERTECAVHKSAVLGGLHHHYFRQAA